MKSFKEIALDPKIQSAITELGFFEPTPIQIEAIPHLLTSDIDLIALAQTGTGKTAAYGLPIIQQIDLNSKITQALVICPTRELCMQITNDLTSYSKFLDGLNVIAVYGGASIETQINLLRKGTQIVVGTPGRMLDLINRKKLDVSHIRWLVLDEADEMLTMGFKEELNGILAGTPEEKQILLFSATMPEPIQTITKKYMTNPVEITIGKKNAGAENVRHQYYMVHADDRYEALKRIADFNPDIYGIVFCRTKKETQEIADKLMVDGYNADSLHGDLSQVQRDIVMNRFRDEHLQLLIATDVAARGLDVNNLSHIINYNLPEDPDIYIHRSGRTGRAGKSGVSISIVHSRAGKNIKELEKKIGKSFEHLMVPNGRQVCEKRLFNLIEKIHQVEVDESQILPFLPDIFEKFSSLDREDIIKKFVWVEFDRFLSYYKDSTDLNVTPKNENKEKDKSGRRSRKSINFTRFYINLGSIHKVNPQRLMGLINEKMRTENVLFGKIEIMKKFSFFEIDSEYANELLTYFVGVTFNGEKAAVELVKKPKRESSRRNKQDFSFNFDDFKDVSKRKKEKKKSRRR